MQKAQRFVVLTRVLAGKLSVPDAALLLKLSERSIRRLTARLESEGPEALVHGNRGRRPAHALDPALKARIVELARTTSRGATTATSASSSPSARASRSRAAACSASSAPRASEPAQAPPAEVARAARPPARGGDAPVARRLPRGLVRQGGALEPPRRRRRRHGRRPRGHLSRAGGRRGVLHAPWRGPLATRGVRIAAYSDKHSVFWAAPRAGETLEDAAGRERQPTQFPSSALRGSRPSPRAKASCRPTCRATTRAPPGRLRIPLSSTAGIFCQGPPAESRCTPYGAGGPPHGAGGPPRVPPQGSRFDAAALGAVGGVALLSRPTMLPFVLLAALPTIESATWATRFRRFAIVAAVIGTIALPWVVRNQFVVGSPTLTTGTGITLWIGNNAAATGSTTTADGQPILDLVPEMRDAVWGQSEGQQDRLFTEAAVRYMAEDPGRTVRSVSQRFALFWSFGPSTGASYPRWWLVAYQVYYWPLVLLAALEQRTRYPVVGG